MTEKPRFCLRSTALIGQLLVALGVYSAAACAQTPPQETGIWLDDSGGGAVEIYVCADRADRLCGRIVWLKEPLNAQGLPKRDRFNPKQELQTRPICGLPVLGNLARVQEGGFDGGWIYDPKAGKSYSAAVELARLDRLTVTGYVGMKFLSKSFTWTRAPADLGRCEGAPGSQAKAAKPVPAQPKPPVASDAAMMAPVTPPAPKPATTATVVPPSKPKPAAPPAAAPPKATAATATGSSAAKVSSTSTSSSKATTGTKPVTGSAPPAKPATAATATTKPASATASAQPNAQAPAPVAKKKPAPVEADNSLVHGPFGWSE
jgi:uncharacterized protein (DUF2147 family)